MSALHLLALVLLRMSLLRRREFSWLHVGGSSQGGGGSRFSSLCVRVAFAMPSGDEDELDKATSPDNKADPWIKDGPCRSSQKRWGEVSAVLEVLPESSSSMSEDDVLRILVKLEAGATS